MEDSCQCMAKPIQYCKVKIKNQILNLPGEAPQTREQ